MSKRRKNRKSKAFTKPARHCWVGKCTAMIEFRRTPKAPKGAWVNSGTLKHHECQFKLARWKRTSKESISKGTGELFTFEELHPIVTQKLFKDYPMCSKCGLSKTYAKPEAPMAHLCPECYHAYLDEPL